MLKEKTLFENIDKVKTAIRRLRRFEPPWGYHLAFSGGKDSIVIKELAMMSGVKFDAHYNVTTIDPPDLIYFIRKYHKDVIWERPKRPFLKLLETKGFPLRRSRWCCQVLKEGGGKNKVVLTGIRWAESRQRATRKVVERDTKSKRGMFLHPIIDWTEQDVWEFIKLRGLPYCNLYGEGWKRIGCLFCPMASVINKKREMEKYPKYVQVFIRAFEKLYQNRKRANNPSVDAWESGREMFDWWIENKPKPQNNVKDMFNT